MLIVYFNTSNNDIPDFALMIDAVQDWLSTLSTLISLHQACAALNCLRLLTYTTIAESPKEKSLQDRVQATFDIRSGRENAQMCDSVDLVAVALDRHGKETVGCAYFNADQGQLCCFEQTEGSLQDTIESLLFDVQPTTVLISPRIEIENVGGQRSGKRNGNSVAIDYDGYEPLPYEIVQRPATDFKFESAVSRLASVEDEAAASERIRYMVPSRDEDFQVNRDVDELGLTDDASKILHLAGQLSLDNRVSIGCAGAILSYLDRRNASEHLPDSLNINGAYRIRRMEMVPLKHTMLVNHDTLTSLQILKSEYHPNVAKQGPGSQGTKESLSLYGLYQHLARTSQGKTRLRRMFLRPSLDLEVINERLQSVSIFCTDKNRLLSKEMSKSLSHVKDMRTTVTNLQKGIDGALRPNSNIKHGIWAAILEFCYHTIDIVNVMQEIDGRKDSNICIRTIDQFSQSKLQRIGRMIHDTVDLESSAEEHRTIIRSNIDADLDKIKTVYNGIETTLSAVAREIALSMPQEVDCSINVIFLPQLGFHVTVPISTTTGDPLYDGGNDL